MRILLAVDGSRFSRDATEAVVTQASPESDQVLVLHVVHTMRNLIPEMRAYYPGVEHGRDAQRKLAEEIVSEAKKLLNSVSLSVTEEIEWGDPKSKIIDAAVDWCADLIVLGSHGKTTVERVLSGSVSDAVMRHAPCSIELVRKSPVFKEVKHVTRLRETRFRKILLAIDDDTRASEIAARFLCEQIHSVHTEVRVLYAIEPADVLLAREMGGYGRWLEEVWKTRALEAEKCVAKIAEEFLRKGIKVSRRILEGDPKSKILEETQKWEADLIVIGSRGRKGLARFLIGSVSTALARHSPCSVEIVRNGRRDVASESVEPAEGCPEGEQRSSTGAQSVAYPGRLVYEDSSDEARQH